MRVALCDGCVNDGRKYVFSSLYVMSNAAFPCSPANNFPNKYNYRYSCANILHLTYMVRQTAWANKSRGPIRAPNEHVVGQTDKFRFAYECK